MEVFSEILDLRDLRLWKNYTNVSKFSPFPMKFKADRFQENTC